MSPRTEVARKVTKPVMRIPYSHLPLGTLSMSAEIVRGQPQIRITIISSSSTLHWSTDIVGAEEVLKDLREHIDALKKAVG